MTTTPVTRRSLERVQQQAPLRQQIYERVEELIIYGELAAGEHLVESQLAQRLGVSRIPVREALQLLNRDGWVDLRPRQGAFVHSPTVEEADEVFTVRTVLEVEATRLAALHPTEVAVRGLRKIIGAGHVALKKGDDRELVRLNSEFHEGISRMAGNRILTQMTGRLDKRIRWFFAPVVKLRGAASWEEHKEMVDAIEASDPDRAAEEMRKHAEATKDAFHAERDRTPSDEP
jgi:DNA-binding GntR family transcriptional regulator